MDFGAYSTQTEDQLHLQCVQWFNTQYSNDNVVLHHSPNENPKGNQGTLIRYNKKMKNLGRCAGFPDIAIFHNSNVILIEFKSKKGVVSKVQKELFQKMDDAGFYVHIVNSFEEFQKITNNFIINQ